MEPIINIFLENPIGQTLGLFGMFGVVFAFLQEDDKHVKNILLMTNVFWLGHFIFMELYTGVAISLISSARIYLSMKYERDIKIFYAITLVTLITGFFTYSDYSSIFPVLASLFATYGFFFLSKVKLRLVLLLCSSFWLNFHYLHLSIGGMVTEVVLHVVHLITIYKIITHEGDMSAYVDKFKSIFIRFPRIDYDRYLAIIYYIKRK